ncbi:MAG: hypothetical protein ACFE0Q_16075 [Anaerolineae bacterium]
MSLPGLLLASLMIVLVLGVTIYPLLQREQRSGSSFRHKQRERALAYYERVLRNLRDLDDDLDTGKIIQAEYELERERWMARGTELLQMLEQLDQAHNINDDLSASATDADIDAKIEQMLTEHQARASAS